MLRTRSLEKEFLDLGPEYYTAKEYEHCLKKLFSVNRLFGFYRSTVNALKAFSPQSSLLDVGCGGGLFLLHLSKQYPDMKFTGCDISSAAIQLAKNELKTWHDNNLAANVNFVLQTQPELDLPANSVDIIHSTLVCHHLSDIELISFLQKSITAAKQGVIVNDLHRHIFAVWLYRLLSPILFRNRLITHDGLISIRRSFTRNDWVTLLNKANIKKFVIKWQFPFRWQVLIWKV